MTVMVSLLVASSASSAPATPATVYVRIEGKTQTLFEGPLRSEGHSVQASSDAQQRPCDGTNGGAHAAPVPTPTAAAVDAMSIVGQTFDGEWSAGFDDYFITRWGPDKQSAAKQEYWGLLVDQAFTAKGGCQIGLAAGDQVLWAYDAFSGRPFLTLAAASDGTNPPLPTAMATLGQPFTVEVSDYTSSEGTHHEIGAVEGAAVSPVSTAANGVQTAETASSATVTTDAAGEATIVFTTPGWHRLKATAAATSRSDRLDVCVPAQGATDCGPVPADDQVRSIEVARPPQGTPPASVPNRQPDPGAPAQQPGSSPVGGSTVLGASAVQGRRTLRLHGLVLAPIDDRASRLIYRGRWRRVSEPGAWLKTISIGSPGASLSFHMGAGRPVLIVRNAGRSARIAMTVGRTNRVFSISASRLGESRLVIGARRARAGVVRVRVLKGTVRVDGVALAS